MAPSGHLAWALLSVGVALWALPVHRGAAGGPPRPALLATAGLLAGLYCALVAGAQAA